MDHAAGPSKGPSQGQTTSRSPSRSSQSPPENITGARSTPESSDTSPTSRWSSARKYPDAGALSPVGSYERDVTTLARLIEAGFLSEGMTQWMALYLRLKEAELEGTSLSTEDYNALHSAQQGKTLNLPPTKMVTTKRPREEAQKRPRQRSRSLSTSPSQPIQKQSRMDSPPPPTLEGVEIKNLPPQPQRQKKTFAQSAAAPKADVERKTVTIGSEKKATPAQPKAAPAPLTRPETTSTTTAKPAEPKREKCPPLIVEKIDNWTAHFKKIASKLGRPPSGRPYGQGIKFTPTDEKEYRVIQAYLSQLERDEKISWFSYSLPAERNLKVAIRGLPVDTPTEEIREALEEKGFKPEYIKEIKGRQGRPGAIYYVLLKKTPDLTPAIYNIDELLYMPGIHIEAWRSKKGPAQCHRCQKFRHSSHNCHREQACVRCGEEHFARECPRPREEPATCANCGGTHPANYTACPVYKKEARNKRAGTVAITSQRRGTAPDIPQMVEENAEKTLMAPANMPKQARRSSRSKAKKKTSQTTTSTQKREESRSKSRGRKDSLGQTIGVFKDILEAVQSGTDAESATLMGLLQILRNGRH